MVVGLPFLLNIILSGLGSRMALFKEVYRAD